VFGVCYDDGHAPNTCWEAVEALLTAMAPPEYDVYDPHCPTRQALDRIADKWTALIVGLLAQRPHRFGELRRGIRGISHKVLSHTLQGLERDGLVRRTPLATVPPTVEYSITPLGRTLDEPLAGIRSWAERHIEAVQAARDIYVRQPPTASSPPGSKASQAGRRRDAE
jgi:DNA-binding HxlR family transcriptional regulator